jgi:hypothetical protein
MFVVFRFLIFLNTIEFLNKEYIKIQNMIFIYYIQIIGKIKLKILLNKIIPNLFNRLKSKIMNFNFFTV